MKKIITAAFVLSIAYGAMAGSVPIEGLRKPETPVEMYNGKLVRAVNTNPANVIKRACIKDRLENSCNLLKDFGHGFKVRQAMVMNGKILMYKNNKKAF